MYYARAFCLLLVAAVLACQSSTLTAAKLYLKQNQPEKAREQLLAALETEPENAEAHFLLGKIYGAEGDYARMVHHFDRSVQLSPKFADEVARFRQHYWAREYNSGVGFAQGETPDFARARRDFQNATLIDSTRLSAWRNLAFVYYQTDSIDEAIATYERIVAVADDDTSSLYSLGVLLLGQQRYEEAEEVLSHLVQIDPGHLEGHINLAVAQVNLGKLAAAEASYRKAIAIDPQAANPHYNLGNLYWQQERYEEAIAAYARAVELDPGDDDALYNLAITYLAVDDIDAALPLLEQLSERLPDNAAVWRELGRVYAIKGQIDKSRRAYAREEALAP